METGRVVGSEPRTGATAPRKAFLQRAAVPQNSCREEERVGLREREKQVCTFSLSFWVISSVRSAGLDVLVGEMQLEQTIVEKAFSCPEPIDLTHHITCVYHLFSD